MARKDRELLWNNRYKIALPARYRCVGISQMRRGASDGDASGTVFRGYGPASNGTGPSIKAFGNLCSIGLENHDGPLAPSNSSQPCN